MLILMGRRERKVSRNSVAITNLLTMESARDFSRIQHLNSFHILESCNLILDKLLLGADNALCLVSPNKRMILAYQQTTPTDVR